MAVDGEILPAWSFRAWTEIRKAAVYAVIIGGAVVTVLKWYVETFPPQKTATKEEIEEMIGTVNDRIDFLAAENVQYRDSMARLRVAVDTQFVRPMLIAQTDLQVRMARVERGGVETRLAVEQSKRQGEQSTLEMIAQMNRQSSSEERAKAQAEARERREKERDRALMEAIAKKLKITESFDTR